ncbi:MULTISPECIES: hypothetical protein [unclassified Streptomyces]
MPHRVVRVGEALTVPWVRNAPAREQAQDGQVTVRLPGGAPGP